MRNEIVRQKSYELKIEMGAFGPITKYVEDIYGVEVSDTTVSRITDKILPIAKEWQQRPLESVYAVVFLDAIHYHVRSEGQIVKKAVYIWFSGRGPPVPTGSEPFQW